MPRVAMGTPAHSERRMLEVRIARSDRLRGSARTPRAPPHSGRGRRDRAYPPRRRTRSVPRGRR
ncbi:hypothetical protein ELQ94_03505 [Labedella endophytica]|uniref:Uncharacterized protein n=1 Tax=Labedella endophytica TaxID=1523160 RepID=A0A433JXL5_9MICO|nr:hypothetical protein ELQ94_03505 [Labedella endophytica]